MCTQKITADSRIVGPASSPPEVANNLFQMQINLCNSERRKTKVMTSVEKKNKKPMNKKAFIDF